MKADGVIEESRMKYNDAYIQLGIESIEDHGQSALYVIT